MIKLNTLFKLDKKYQWRMIDVSYVNKLSESAKRSNVNRVEKIDWRFIDFANRCRDYSHIRKINVHWPVEVPRPVQTVVGPQRSVTLVFLFRQRRAARPEESSRDVHYHRESWTRLCTGTEELVPFPLPFLSVQLKLEAEGHPKVALGFNQTKMVSIS